MRPPRADIAAPPFPPGTEWVNGPEPDLARTVAKGPLLVHFLDFAQLNCLRALPYLLAWRDAYEAHGLAVLGVHSPRYPFTRPAEAVAEAMPRLGIGWPVAVDERLAIWRDYGCRGWPSLFLWGRGGVLRWHHLGEGEYRATEDAIRESLGPEAAELPDPMQPIRPEDAPGARVMVPSQELFPGGGPDRPWSPASRKDSIELDYRGGGAQLAAEGDGSVAIRLDGEELDPIEIRGPGAWPAVEHPRHESHRLELSPDPGVRIYSVQFPPAPPD